MLYFPTNLNKAVEASITYNLSFSFFKTIGNYRKKFFVSNFDEVVITLRLNSEELIELKKFLNEDLKYSTIPFLNDFNIGFGDREYKIIDKISYNIFEADLYSVKLTLLQKKEDIDLTCTYAYNCLNSLKENINNENLLLENNVEATYDQIQTGVCILNINKLIKEDINEYSKTNIFI